MAGRKKKDAGAPLLDHAASDTPAGPREGATAKAKAPSSTTTPASPGPAARKASTAKSGTATKPAKTPKNLPRFQHQTVLFHWVLSQLELPSVGGGATAEQRWDALKLALEAVEAEAWVSSPTPLGQALITTLGLDLPGPSRRISADDLLRWDARVFAVTLELNHASRAEPVQWKYFQYLALVFTELYLERYFTNAEALREDLDSFLANFKPQGVDLRLPPYRVDPETELDDLCKLAFWMATGSGKTWLFHANLKQVLAALERYGKPLPDRILLVTPNAGLSAQHKAELDLANIPARLFRKGDTRHRKTVQIIEITKFSKKPGPDTIAVESLEGRNLVFVDEGHRGSSSADGEWRGIRQALARQGFCFEYSATFAQAAAKAEEIRQEYAKSILVDYAYRKFHGDGYGKHYRIMNIRGSSAKARELEGHHRRAYLTGALVVLTQQLVTWDEDKELATRYGLDRPFCVFVGASVTGGENETTRSDVVLILELIAQVVREREATERILDDLLNGRSGFATRKGQDVFDVSTVLPELHARGYDKSSLYEAMLAKVFNAGPQGGTLHLQRLEEGEGEIGLFVGEPTSTAPFGVINVGDPRALIKSVEAGLATTSGRPMVHISEQGFKGSLFSRINEPGSRLTMLVGSRKFTEGWSSWRVSLMGLLNIGKSAGTQIVQLFGRGVRLRGQNRSLKRASEGEKVAAPGKAMSKLRVLETLNIFGVRADYMELFEEELRQEGIEDEPEPHVEVLPVLRLDPLPDLRVVKLPDEREWKREERPPFLPELKVGRVVVDAYARVDIKSRGPGGVMAAAINVERGPLPCFAFVDHDLLYRDLFEHKTRMGWTNLGLPRVVSWRGQEVPLTRALLGGDWYEVRIPKREVEPGRLQNLGLWQQLASELLLKYLGRFRSTMLGRYQAERAEIVWLADLPKEKREALFPSEITITVARGRELEDTVTQLVIGVKKLLEEKTRDFHRPIPNLIEALGWGRHLYQPLVYIPKSGKKSMSVESKPVALNEGEWLLVTHLKTLVERASYLSGVDVWLLRNPSRNGLGFRDVRGAFPDFILWLVRGDEQWFTFVDPHGIRMVTDPANEPKLHLWKTLKEIEGRHPGLGVHLDAWVLSVTPEHEASPALRPFEDHHLIYQDNEGRYLEMLMRRLLGIEGRTVAGAP